MQVVNVHLPIDRETGARRPFGFVEFDSEAEADAALAATSHSIAGRDVSIWPWIVAHHCCVCSISQHCMQVPKITLLNRYFL